MLQATWWLARIMRAEMSVIHDVPYNNLHLSVALENHPRPGCESACENWDSFMTAVCHITAACLLINSLKYYKFALRCAAEWMKLLILNLNTRVDLIRIFWIFLRNEGIKDYKIIWRQQSLNKFHMLIVKWLETLFHFPFGCAF